MRNAIQDSAGRTLVCLFAKAPLLGRVKTRMMPRLSEQECLQLHKDMIAYMTRSLSALPDNAYSVQLHVTEPHHYFDELSTRYRWQLKRQCGADLGARMSHAVEEGLRDYAAVIVVGADCPFVDKAVLEKMAATMHSQAVLVPALDGGYVAMLLREHHDRIFDDIRWGSPDVAQATLARLREINWPCELLEACPDIDRPEDLAQLVNVPELAAWAAKV